MYTLFQLDSAIQAGTQRHASWMTIHRGLVHALRTVTDFYPKHSGSVKTDHILSKIIAPFGAGETYTLRDFYLKAVDEALDVSRTLKMTSSLYEGHVHRGQFYGPGISEVLIATDTAFDYQDTYTNWEKAQAVRVLASPITNLGLDIPDGINRSGDTGFVVIEIHIPKLLIQYKAFRDAEEIRFRDYGLPERTTYQFIHRFVLPNMMGSHLDTVLVNRLHNVIFDEPMNDKRPNHSFHIPDWARDVEKFHYQLKDYLMDKSLNAGSIMKAIPLVSVDSGVEYAPLPRVARTRQVKWALVLARLNLLEIIVKVSVVGHGNMNRRELNAIKRELEFYRNDRTFTQVMPRALQNETLYRWERLLGMIG